MSGRYCIFFAQLSGDNIYILRERYISKHFPIHTT